MACNIKVHELGLVVNTPFNRAFVNDLKYVIPSTARRWNNKSASPKNAWIVHPDYGRDIQKLIMKHYNEQVSVPSMKVSTKQFRDKFKILYVGASKDREDGTTTSFAMFYDGEREWGMVIPEDVLRNYFEGTPIDPKSTKPKENVGSLYLTLGLKKQTDDEDEIKSAYRRMIRQWHPDICKEPDAHERAQDITEAYDTLKDPKKRIKYRLGLKMVDENVISKKKTKKYVDSMSMYGYKPALRCGILDVSYTKILGRAVVTKIHGWEDIVNPRHETLVVSWIYGDDAPIEMWV